MSAGEEYQSARLNEAKATAVAEIRAQAEAERGRYITLAPGKVGEYAQKREAVQRWVLAGRPAAPVEAEYPIAVAEAAAYGITMGAMLAVWAKRSHEWAQASAQIAVVERRAMLGIERAGSIEAVEAVVRGVSWKGRD